MIWNDQGITREVFLTRRYAIKIPKIIYGWQKFLHGLLANMQERAFAKSGWPELCPVVFSIPGGWLIVMRRADPLTDDEWGGFDPKAFCDHDDYIIPAEGKRDSFGKINGQIVAIDYGS